MIWTVVFLKIIQAKSALSGAASLVFKVLQYEPDQPDTLALDMNNFHESAFQVNQWSVNSY